MLGSWVRVPAGSLKNEQSPYNQQIIRAFSFWYNIGKTLFIAGMPEAVNAIDNTSPFTFPLNHAAPYSGAA
jgi:hypothetical protein